MQPQNVFRRELIIGTYTEQLPHVDGRAEGILSCSFDGATVGPAQLRAATTNPSYLALSDDRNLLYAVNETVAFEGKPGGSVSAFARDGRTGELSFLNAKPSGGRRAVPPGARPDRPFPAGCQLRFGFGSRYRAPTRREPRGHDRARAARGLWRPPRTPDRSPRPHGGL